jgi:peptidoglycan DL-endopeptidase CwlO
VAPLRPIFRALVGAAVSAAVVLAASAHAYAAPSVADIEKQIDDQWNVLEPTIEHYNQVHGQLKDNQSKADALKAQLLPLSLQVDVASARVSDMAGRYYVSGQGSLFVAALTGQSPTDFVDKLMLVNSMAHLQRSQIASVAALRDKALAEKKKLDAVLAQLGAQDADLAAKKKDIEGKINDLQKLRQQAYGSAGATGNLKPVACPVEYVGGPAGVAVNKACSLIGSPYQFGSTGPKTFDCSGLTLAAWAAAGVTLYHYTRTQYQNAKPVARADLRPGDLVFFYSDLHHVGLYVGGGWMVHAPTTGDYVRMAKIDGRPIAGYRRP